MKIVRLTIRNFRGIRYSSLLLPDHAVLIGDNNTGKSTILEAIDLALGPDRLSRRPPVDEHDFFCGRYLAPAGSEAAKALAAAEASAPSPQQQEPQVHGVAIYDDIDENPDADKGPEIRVDVVIIALNDEQQAHFRSHIEWWSKAKDTLYQAAKVEGVDAPDVVAALRVTFIGKYDPDEDDFEGTTYFTASLEAGAPDEFRKRDKQKCGFLYLRSLRTGSRALSLEHGSLLDIVLRIKEVRPQMWEETLKHLAGYDVASDPALGISGVLESLSTSLKKFVPKEWGAAPHLKVSSLTRDHLRRVITAFINTGDGDHAAPFFRQGTGTINMLVLALLSQIAEGKQNVVFAMEEPETAIPPYAQKRIVHEVRKLSAQSIFTSHSPYVLEEFTIEETVALSRTTHGELVQATLALPNEVKHKRYRQEFRTRFCEGLLARRVLVCEGATEATSIVAAARRLSELNPADYTALEGLGLCIIDAGSETMVKPLAAFYRSLGKTTYGLCDKQAPGDQLAIEQTVDELFMHPEKGMENLVLKNTTKAALDRYCDALVWPPHLVQKFPTPKADAVDALKAFFSGAKGNWGLADFLVQCTEAETPVWIRDTCKRLKLLCDPPAPTAAATTSSTGVQGASATPTASA